MVSTSINAENLTEDNLSNGLKVLYVQDPSASLVSVRTYVNAGSITEGPFLGTGISHYLEHLLAGGTTSKRSENTYKGLLSRLGGAFNAYTTSDHTSYYINTIPKELPTAIDILYEWMFFSAFTDREVNRERNVIIKEIEKNNANINRQFYQQSQQNFYKFHPAKHPVIGYLDKFKTVDKEDLITYYKTHYAPSNMILVIGGNFDLDKIQQKVNKTFGSIPYMSPPPVSPVFKEPYPFAQRVHQVPGKTSTTLLSIRFSSIDLYHSDLYALDLSEFILSNGLDSLLYKVLVEEQKLAYSIDASSYTPPQTTGYFEISADIDYENKDKAIAAIMEVVEDLKDGKINSGHLAKAKKQKLSDDIFSVDNVEDKVVRAGQSYLYGHADNFFEHYVTSFKSVNKDDVVRVANEYLNIDKAVITVMYPDDLVITKSKQVGNAASLSKPKLLTLDNGLRVILKHDASVPKVESKLFAMGGIRAETSANNGIGVLAAGNLGKQSKKYPKKIIQEKIEGNGASLYGSFGNNTVYLSLMTLSEDFEDLFPIQIDAFLNPVFGKKEVEEEKRQLIKGIKKRPDDWFSNSYYQFKKAFYGDHHYGLPKSGEVESVSPLTPKDLAAHHDQFLVPSQMLLTVFGDFDETALMAEINKKLATLKPSETAFDSSPKAAPISHKKPKKEVRKIDQDVAAIFIGFDGIKIQDTEGQIQFDLLDSVLSGMKYPGGRLHNLLREKGMVYMVHGLGVAGIERGHFLFYALSSKDKIKEVQDLILKQIADVKKAPVSKREFDLATAQMRFYYKDRLASSENLAVITATDELYGLGVDYHEQLDGMVDKLSPVDVQKAAKKYLNNPQIFIFQK